MKTKMTLSQQLDKTYALAVHMGYIEAAEFLKSLLTKYDIIENKKVKRGTPIQGRNKNAGCFAKNTSI
jgi:hypothetical protein